MERLLTNNFDDCIVDLEVTVCPVKASQQSTTSAAATPTPGSDDATEQGEATATPAASVSILLVDDNRRAEEGELSEADAYLTILYWCRPITRLVEHSRQRQPEGG